MKVFILIFFLLVCCHVISAKNFTLYIDCNNPLHHEKGCGPCNNTEDCGGYQHGVCIQNVCRCSRSYYGPNCEGKRKDKTTAFLLTFMVGPLFCLPPGAGRLYLEYWKIGIGQIILGISWLILIGPLMVVLIFSLFSWTISNSKRDIEFYTGFFCFCGHSILSIIFIILIIMSAMAALIWWMVDWIMILNNSLDDANGHKLSSW